MGPETGVVSWGPIPGEAVRAAGGEGVSTVLRSPRPLRPPWQPGQWPDSEAGFPGDSRGCCCWCSRGNELSVQKDPLPDKTLSQQLASCAKPPCRSSFQRCRAAANAVGVSVACPCLAPLKSGTLRHGETLFISASKPAAEREFVSSGSAASSRPCTDLRVQGAAIKRHAQAEAQTQAEDVKQAPSTAGTAAVPA